MSLLLLFGGASAVVIPADPHVVDAFAMYQASVDASASYASSVEASASFASTVDAVASEGEV